MNSKTRLFFGAFAITAILIGALCGFVAVDLSTEQYMPDKFGSFFEITGVEPGCIDFSFLANGYSLDTTYVSDAVSILKGFRGLFPDTPRIASALAGAAAGYFID